MQGFSGCLACIVSILLTGGLAWSGMPCRAECAESAPAVNHAQPLATVSDDDLLFCLVRLAGTPLKSDLPTYMQPGGKLLLPLGELSRLLEFGITVDVATGSAGGYTARPGQSFLLDTKNGSVSVKGKPQVYDASRIMVLTDDIYVESGLLADWFFMRIEAKRLDALIDIRPYEPLPLQQRLARERQGANTWGYGSSNDPGFPLQKIPYRILGGPGVDLSLSTSLSGDTNDTRIGDTRFTSKISGDLLWMNATLDLSGYIASKQSLFGIENGQLMMERVNPDGGLLGALDARRFALGDINPSALPLIGRSTGPGIMISNYPITQSQYFDMVTLKGFLGKGWDVELYRNGSVLDYRPSNAEETYLFADIPLVYGFNELELIFNGPQGERKTESHQYYVGRNMIEPGSWAYQIALSDSSRNSLFSSPTDPSSSLSPIATWKSDIGLTRWLTTSQSLAWQPGDDSGQKGGYFAGFGFSGYLQMMQIDVQAANNLSLSSWARQANMISKIGPLSCSLQWQEFDNGWEPLSGTATFRRRLSGRIDGFRPIPFLRSSSLSLGGERIDYDDNRQAQRYSLTNTNRFFGVNNTHRLALERMQDGAGRQDALSGYSYASISRRGCSFRLEADYRLIPEKNINSIMGSTEIPLYEQTLVTGTLSYTPSADKLAFSLGFNHTGHDLTMGIKGGYATTGLWDVGLRLSIGLIREPRKGRWLSDARSIGAQGSVSARAFLDQNLNKLRDDDEPLLENVGFLVDSRKSEEKTDSTGTAFLPRLAPNIPANISISQTTLEDILWIPAHKGTRVVPRPGYPVELEFPVWGTGEVSGMVYSMQNGIRKNASGIVIEALDKDGNVIAKKISEYDGFYVIDKIPPGGCTLRVSPEQAARFGVSVPSRKIDINSSGSTIDHIDFALFYPEETKSDMQE